MIAKATETSSEPPRSAAQPDQRRQTAATDADGSRASARNVSTATRKRDMHKFYNSTDLNQHAE